MNESEDDVDDTDVHREEAQNKKTGKIIFRKTMVGKTIFRRMILPIAGIVMIRIPRVSCGSAAERQQNT